MTRAAILGWLVGCSVGVYPFARALRVLTPQERAWVHTPRRAR